MTIAQPPEAKMYLETQSNIKYTLILLKFNLVFKVILHFLHSTLRCPFTTYIQEKENYIEYSNPLILTDVSMTDVSSFVSLMSMLASVHNTVYLSHTAHLINSL